MFIIYLPAITHRNGTCSFGFWCTLRPLFLFSFQRPCFLCDVSDEQVELSLLGTVQEMISERSIFLWIIVQLNQFYCPIYIWLTAATPVKNIGQLGLLFQWGKNMFQTTNQDTLWQFVAQLLNMAIETMSFPVKNGGSFHGYANVYQRVYLYLP